MSKARTENFPVASRFLPKDARGHLLAIYGFARLVDDLGDEAPADRAAHLDWLDHELDLVFEGDPTHPLLQRLVPTVRRCRIPPEPFRKLIAANRQDQVVSTYRTFDELLAYCELSANPVGRLVLLVLGASTPERTRRSDAVCTGLQLVEHWQDIAEDLARGRVYLPREDMERFGVSAEDLAAPRAGAGLRRLLAFETERSRRLLDEGAPLAGDLGGRAGLAVVAFVAGGRSALHALHRAGYDVLGQRPRPSRARRAWTFLQVAAASRRQRGEAAT